MNKILTILFYIVMSLQDIILLIVVIKFDTMITLAVIAFLTIENKMLLKLINKLF